MLKNTNIKLLLGALALTSVVGFASACPDGATCDDDSVCAVGVDAWRCPLANANDPIYCGSEATAQTSCDQAGGGTVVYLPVCDGDGGGDDGASDPIDPDSSDIWINPASGYTMIDQDFLDDILDGTLSLDDETTTLTEQTSGYYEIDNIDAGSLADELGFEDGDEIREINGIDLDEPNYIDAYLELQTETEFTVYVIRDSRRIGIDYETQ